jgi:transcriptional regulator with GAF, ATPase, and Fis domain
MEGAEAVHSTIYRDSLAEVILYVSEAAQNLLSASSVTDTLARVVELAVTTIDGCDFAGIFLIDGDAVATAVHSDPIVMEIDALQHRNGEGPCLDVLTHRLIFYADDLSNDLRWPNFAPDATSAGIRSVLTLPFSMDSQRGVLNLCARYPDAFGVVDRAKATVLASLASLALSIAHSHEDEKRRAAAYHSVITSRELLGKAVGILMERERITADQAFDILRRASQHLHIKLREVAQNLIDTGEDPDTGQRDE